MRSDLGEIIHLLESSKIRDRNEGLDKVESLPFKTLQFKQYNEVIKALLQLITIETRLNDKNASAVTRKKKSSYLIRSIIETCIYKRPKYSSFISHILEMANVCDDIIITDVLKCITLILNQQYIKDHLNSENWLQIFNFLSSNILKYANSQLIDVFSTLNNLVCHNSINYIPIYKIDHHDLCLKLHSIVNTSLSPILVNQLLILINRLLVVFSCHDFTFTKSLIILVFELLNTYGSDFNFNNSIPLNSQIGILLNLDIIHSFILHYWPKEDNVSDDDDDDDQINLTNLIRCFLQNTLSKYLSSSRSLSVQFIGFRDFSNTSRNWFKLKTIYFKNTDPTVWLLLLGCSKLLRTYFNLNKSKPVDKSLKRMRHDLNNIALHDCENFLEFIQRLFHQGSSKRKLLGLYLLTFQTELYPIVNSAPPNSSTTEDFNLSDSLLFIELDKSPSSSILNSILSFTSSTSLSHWSLICLNSILVNSLNFETEVFEFPMNKILKLILPLVKLKDFSNIISETLYNLILVVIHKHLVVERDETLISQIQSIVDLSYISGPFNLNNSGLLFWVAFVKLSSIIGLDLEGFKPQIIRWIEYKWNDILDPNANNFLQDVEYFPNFIDWINGRRQGIKANFEQIDYFKGKRFTSVHSLMLNFTIFFAFMENQKENKDFEIDIEFIDHNNFNLQDRLLFLSQELVNEDPIKIVRFNNFIEQLGFNFNVSLPSKINLDTIHKLIQIPSIYPRGNGFESSIISELLSTKDSASENESVFDDEFTQKNENQVILTSDELLDSCSQDGKIPLLHKLFRDENINVDFLNNLDDDLVLYSVFLSVYESKNYLNDDCLYALGNGPLSNVLYERNELTLITVCCTTDPFNSKASIDMFNWLLMAGSKRLILTTTSCTSYLKLLLKVMKQASEADFRVYCESFFQYFNYVTADIRLQLINDINSFLSIQPDNQMIFYKSLIHSYKLDTVESIVEYCIMLGSIKSGSLKINKMIIFNLLESAANDSSYMKYVKKALIKFKPFNKVFNLAKLDIFRSWWISHNTFSDFPYQLLKLSSIEAFLNAYSTELISVILAFKNDDSVIEKYFTKDQIIYSIPVAIPLAYVKMGVKHNIEENFKRYLNDTYQTQRLIHLDNLILQCFKLLDVSNMSPFFKILNHKPIYELSDIEGEDTLLLSPETGMQLIQRLIKKCIPNENYWNTPRIYFMVRSLSMDLHVSDSRLILRKILVICLWGKKHLINDKLIKLIFHDILLMNKLEIGEVDHIFMLLNISDMQLIEKVSENIDKLILIFCGLTNQYNLMSNDNINFIVDNNQGVNCDFFKGLRDVLIYKRSIKRVELGDFNKLEINNNFELAFDLISCCLKQGVDISHNVDFVKALIHFNKNVELFNSWSLKTIAKDFIDNEYQINEQYIKKFEFDDISSFEHSSQALFSIIYELKESDDSKIAWIANICIGIVLGKTEEFNHLNYNFNEILVFKNGYECIFKAIQPNYEVEDNIIQRWIKSRFFELIDNISIVTESSLLYVLNVLTPYVKDFTHKCLPYLICYFLENLPKRFDYISELINEFLNNENYHTREVTEIFLKAVLLIRISSILGNPPFKMVYLNIDMTKLCNLASNFGFYQSSLMLLEESVNDNKINPEWHKLTFVNNIFESIDDDDLLTGLPEETSLDLVMKRIYRNNESSSEKLKYQLGEFDSNLTFGLNNDISSLLSTMSEEGLSGISSIISRDVGDKNTEWSWKLQNWDLPPVRSPINSDQFTYKILKEYDNSDNTIVSDLFKMKHNSLLNCNPKKLHEGFKEFYKSLLVYTQFNNDGDNNLKLPINENSPFDMVENVILAKSFGCQISANKLESNDDEKDFKLVESIHALVNYNDLAIKNNHQQKAINSMILIDKLVNNPQRFNSVIIQNKLKNLSKFQTAKSLWNQNYSSMAINMMKEVEGSKTWDDKVMNQTQTMVNAILVRWLSDSRQELPNTIMETYVLPADLEQCIQNDKNNPLTPKIYRKLAEFCETQSKSTEIINELNKLEKQSAAKKRELSQIKDHFNGAPIHGEEKRQIEIYYGKLKKRMIIETDDLNNLKKIQNNFKSKAVEFYLKSNEDNEESIDKFFSLWLQDTTNEKLNRKIAKILKTIPTHKLVPWISQLISRLLDESNSFQSILHELIKKICLDHPIHSLYPLFSLQFHSNYVNRESNLFMLSKIKASNKVISALSMEPSLQYLDNFFNPIKKFCDESINLSKFKQQSRTKFINLLKIPELKNYWIDNIKNFKITSPTSSIKLSPLKNYDSNNIPYILSIDTMVTIANTGISLPKIIKFKLSNGTEQKNLFKYGTDDLRQDAIMEQVFEKVNGFFQKNKHSRKRDLRVRTYKIIPMGPQSGIIEYVPNSMSLNDIIKPYHAKDIMRVEKARDLMKTCQREDKEERIKVFKKIIHQINPVLRLFFFDTFLKPNDWFSSKLIYSRGLAASSIVGHILGLGDRHCNNIMLDKLTGEPIHIDLGVAFDHGKTLPIPETVPFRLTRDLVDGLGITGVDGIFRKNCELTLSVLRDNREHIISILEILRYDPLYSWSLSPLRKAQLQNDHDDLSNKEVQEDASEAGQAVQTVVDKLQASGLNVETVIRELINSATNIENLALIYCGWSPFY